MKYLRYIYFLLLFACAVPAIAHDDDDDDEPDPYAYLNRPKRVTRLPQYADSAIFQGVHIKVDVGNAAVRAIQSKGETQQYEALVSVNLLKTYYPTIEFGYAKSANQAAGGSYQGAGGFTRIGLDLNPLKKSRNNDYALLVGFRIGVGVQDYTMSGINLHDNYWHSEGTFAESSHALRADCWGEIVANVQVKVAGPFFMGWAGRVHALFTKKGNPYTPYFIPGYGFQDAGIFGFSYYLGLRF